MAVTQVANRSQEDSTATGPEGYLPIAPNKPFTYFHADQGWMWDPKGKRWVPYLNKVIGVRGANGVGSNGSTAPAVAVAMQRGHRIIQPQDKMLGPYKNYLYSFPCISRGGLKGKHWVTAYETPTVRGRAVRWKTDTKGYYEFLAYLVTKGIVSPMGEDILEEKLELAQDRIERLAKHGANPVYQKKIKAAEKSFTDMRKAWEKQFGGVEGDDA